MGTFIGALYAAGRTASEINVHVYAELCSKIVQRIPASFTSLARGECGRAMLLRGLREIRLDETAHGLVVASAEIYEWTRVYNSTIRGCRGCVDEPPCPVPSPVHRWLVLG